MSKLYIYIDNEGNMTRAMSTFNNIESIEKKIEVSKKIFDDSINNFKNLGFNNPKVKKEKIESFLKCNLENINLEEFLEETLPPDIKYKKILTDEQKDIKFLAETLKTFIEPMTLPEDGQANPALEKLQEIIDRYNT